MSRQPVFPDTVGLLAIWNADDQWNPVAAPVFATLAAQGRRLVITSYVLLECGNAAARRTFRNDVTGLRRALLARQALIEPTSEDIEQAWNAFERRESGTASIVDHVSFIVMRRFGLTEAFTNDAHFKAAGFATLF
ncbi:MAG: type II toxin-antitoxin system VapC family toxin [Isosphaeraceae bacterium]